MFWASVKFARSLQIKLSVTDISGDIEIGQIFMNNTNKDWAAGIAVSAHSKVSVTDILGISEICQICTNNQTISRGCFGRQQNCPGLYEHHHRYPPKLSVTVVLGVVSILSCISTNDATDRNVSVARIHCSLTLGCINPPRRIHWSCAVCLTTN